MSALWDAVGTNARPKTALHLPFEGRSVPVTQLLADAERTATVIAGRRRVGILMANGEPWLRGLLACFRIGAAAVPIALPVAFGSSEGYQKHLRRVIEDAELETLLVDGQSAHLLSRLGTLPNVRLDDITEVPEPAGPVGENPADEFAVIQYTSGSTSAPKGVALTADTILAGLAAIADGLGLTETDEIGIWLPLFHDMGLFGMLAHLARGCSVNLWRTTDFLRDTRGWLAGAAASGASVLPMPNFAYQRMVDAVEAGGAPDGLDLSGWRAACNGAEPVRWSTLEAFNRVFGPYGFRPEAMLPCYGMAEATLVVSWATPKDLPWHLTVDRFALAPGDEVARVAPEADNAREVVACGSAAPGIAFRIDAPGAGQVGEVQIRGAAVMGGYLGLPADQQPFTSDGWLRTGDLGFEAEGELFLVGRLKDMAIIRGQNYYAEDVEQIARRVQGFDVRACAALQARAGGFEHLAVLVATPLEGAEAAALTSAVEAAISAELGPGVAFVHPVPVRSIPHTSSGKVRRQAARDLYQKTVKDAS